MQNGVEQAKAKGGRGLSELATMTFEEWEKKGILLFGLDRFKWKFKCPSCGNVQCAEDFREYEAKGAKPNDAMTVCIGRYTPKGMKTDILSGKRPCNYASFGLFNLNPMTVIRDGKEYTAFAFAE